MAMTRSWGFHNGEVAVQERAGVLREAARLSGMLAPTSLEGGAGRFLGERDFAVLTAQDQRGRLWTSPVVGAPGFLDGDGTLLRVHARPDADDPLHDAPTGQAAGLIAIDFGTRRRFRVNGALGLSTTGELEIEVDQAYGNCPQFIQQRRLDPGASTAAASDRPASLTTALSTEQADVIRRADTFFLGTRHPDRGADASHRGGTAGFVRIEGNSLWWPDYAGNNMFNSLGNLAADGRSALLFIDFTRGVALHLSGSATVEWLAPGSPGDDGGTGRRVRFDVRQVLERQRSTLKATPANPYRRNPPLSEARTAG
jgi:predicted pyridoxine 5'-phosphate oxidase superfamily flavin-nucleotide-binding protein